MAEESPFIEEGAEPELTETETEKVDVDALLGQLEKFNVTDAKKLEGKLRNASDYSKIQSERDLLANELAQMRAEIAGMKKEPAQPKNQSFDDFDSERAVDIETLAENAARRGVRKEFQAQQEAQMKQQQWMASTWNKISGHPKYHLVKDEYEEALKDPATYMNIMNGKVDPVAMMYDMLVEKYEGVTKQTVAAFKQLRGAGKVSAPHVESGARVPGDDKAPLTDKDKKVNELRKKAQKPGGLHEDEEDFMIDAVLGDMFTEP